MERTLALIKPDAVQRGLVGAIISRLEQQGLKLIAMKMLRMDRALAEKLYAVHQEQSFFAELLDFITSAPIVASVWEGPRAIEVVRQTMGQTDPSRAAPGTIRGDFALQTRYNLIHGSDSAESAEREISLFFSGDDLLNYERDAEKWLTGS